MHNNNSLDKIDWSFSSLSNSGIHSVHWYPATYISAIPGVLIPSLSDEGSTILDPFCGSGTTGIEALRLGNKFIGIDTNPIALLITESKLYYPEPKALQTLTHKLVREAQELLSLKKTKKHPQHSELKGWYHPATLAELSVLLTQIVAIPNVSTRKCILAIFSSILKNTSSQGKHWGWVCDNVKPKPDEITYKNAFTNFLRASEEYISASKASYRSLKEISSNEVRRDSRRRYKLLQGDCVRNMQTIKENSIDLIITSPPYYGVADYIKSQRLSYLWFDIDKLSKDKLGFKDFEMLRTLEKGARSNRHRKNSRALYLEFILDFFKAASRVLKKDAYISMVVGESRAREETTEALIDCAFSSGFDLELRKERDIKLTRRRLMAKVKGEEVLVFRNKRNKQCRATAKPKEI